MLLRSDASLSLLLGCALLCGPATAQALSPSVAATEARESKEAGSPWGQRRGLDLVHAKDRAFVEQLDQAWSSGNPDNVLDLFDFLHPQARRALASRVMMTSSGLPLRRTSKILSAREETDASGQRVLGLWLSVDLRSEAEQDRPGRDSDELFELLVLREKDATVRGRLLLQTTRNWQIHVQAKAQNRADLTAEALGRDQLFRCRVCNYEVGSPPRGNWVVLARPSFLSACIEAVDVFSLDEDLAMEVSVHPHGARSAEDLRTWLERCASMLGMGLVDDRPRLGEFEEIEIGGSHGWSTSMELHLDEGVRRGFRLYATHHGDATYLFAIQGPPSLVRMQSADAKALLETFRLLDPSKPVTSEGLLTAFGGPGRFSEDGSAYSIEKLGVRMPGFAEWRRERRLGIGAFHASWLEEKTGTTLRLIGVERPTGSWSTRAVVHYLAQLIKGNQGHLNSRPEFRVLGKLERKELGGHDEPRRTGYWLDFEYLMPQHQQPGRCRGFVCAVPLGRLLLLLVGEAMPGARQEELLEAMRARAEKIEID